MSDDLHALTNRTQATIYHAVKWPADIVENSLDLERIGKCVLSIFSFYELSFMPDLPVSCVQVNKEVKSFVDLIGAVKITTRIRDFASIDEVGRSYWKTHTWTEITIQLATTGYTALSTAKYVSKIFMLTYPIYLSNVKNALMFGASTLRIKKDIQSIRKLNKQIVILKTRKVKCKGKKSELSEIKDKYLKKLVETKSNIVSKESQLNQFIKDPNIKVLSTKKNLAFDMYADIKKKKEKCRRWEQYLELDTIKEYRDLKDKKWESRIAESQNECYNKKYSLAANVSVSLSLGIGLVATAVACEHIAILTLLGGMNVLVSSIVIADMINHIPKKQ